jgi:hypothetical protein
MLILGAAAVGAAAMIVGPTAAPAGAEPCAPMVVPTPGCTSPDAPPPNSPGAAEAAVAADIPDDPAAAPAVQPAGPVCPPNMPWEQACIQDTPPPAGMALAPPPPNPCNDAGYFMSNTAICMNPQIAGEAQSGA